MSTERIIINMNHDTGRRYVSVVTYESDCFQVAALGTQVLPANPGDIIPEGTRLWWNPRTCRVIPEPTAVLAGYCAMVKPFGITKCAVKLTGDERNSE